MQNYGFSVAEMAATGAVVFLNGKILKRDVHVFRYGISSWIGSPDLAWLYIHYYMWQ